MDMVTGIVKNNWNDKQPGKVQVEYRFGEEGICLSGWMPVMTGSAGPGYGTYILPETGSEVIVAFLHGDPDCPFVAGCIWGATNTLPEGAAVEKNTKKLFRTKGGWQFLIDEEEKNITLTDEKKENTITLSSKEGILTLNIKTKLMLQVDGKDFFTLEKEKLTISQDLEIQAKKLTVKAEKGMELGGKSLTITPDKEVSVKGKEIELSPSQNVTLKGQKIVLKPGQGIEASGGKIELKPTQSLEIKSMQTKIEGTTLELKGSASAKVEAGGMMQVKGAMLKLN